MDINGKELYVFAQNNGGYIPIGASTHCLFRVDAAAIGVCSTMSGHRRVRPGKSSWRVECDGFYFFNKKLTAVGQPLVIVFSVLQKELLQAGVIFPDGIATLKGDAIVTDVLICGTANGVATYEIEFTGSGEMWGFAKDSNGFPYSFPIVF